MQALNDLGWLIRVHSYEEAISHHQQALRIAEELDDPADAGHGAQPDVDDLPEPPAARRRSGAGPARARASRGRPEQDQLLGAALDCLKFAALPAGPPRPARTDRRPRSSRSSNVLGTSSCSNGPTSRARRCRSPVATSTGPANGSTWLPRSTPAWIRPDLAGDAPRGELVDRPRCWRCPGRGRRRERGRGHSRGTDQSGVLRLARRQPRLAPDRAGRRARGHRRSGVCPGELRDGQEPQPRPAGGQPSCAWARWLVGDDDGSRAALRQRSRCSRRSPRHRAMFLYGYRSYLAVARTWIALGDPRSGRACWFRSSPLPGTTAGAMPSRMLPRLAALDRR